MNPAGGRGAVLIVDDEEQVRAVTRRVCERAGFEVFEAGDGVAALDIYRASRERIGVVLLDLTMPRMGGAETFEELRRLDPHVRVVLTSGYGERDATKGFAAGSLAGFLRKPSPPDLIVARLRAALSE